MKRVLLWILMLAMTLSLAACGGSTEDSRSTEPTGTHPQASEQEPIPTADPFSQLEEEYIIDLPLYSLETFYSSLGDDTYTYSNVVYDEQGRMISWDKQENNHAAHGYSAEYDENGRLSSVTYHHSLYGYTEVYQYDEQGLLIAKTKTEPDDEDYYLTHSYSYDHNGMLSGGKTVSSSDFYDGGIDEYSFEKDEYGRIVKKNDYSVDTDYGHENIYEYNDAGQTVKSKESTIDEGMLKYVYDTTYEYNAYGFPIYAYVDNSYDYKGDTVQWESRSTYAITGYLSVNSAEDAILNPVSSWVPYDEENTLPTADSVLSGLVAESAIDGVYRYAIPADETVCPRHEIFGIMQGLNDYGVIDLRAYSAHDTANQILWRYEGVINQLLGIQTGELDGKMVIKDGNFALGTVSVENEGGTFYLVVNLG